MKVFESRVIDASKIVPNPWNPNRMTPEERRQLALEIRKFGFVDPLTVRPIPTTGASLVYQIIDGENRFVVGVQDIKMTHFPCVVLDVDEDTAKQLTPILNELHGHPEDQALGDLLKDLLGRIPEAELREVMPYDKDRFDQLTSTMTVDWSALDKIAAGEAPGSQRVGGTDRWVERVYRMPAEAAEVVDQAIAKAREEGDTDDDWRGLEFIAAEFMGR